MLILGLFLSGCVDHEAVQKTAWSRAKRNADKADVCIKSGGLPKQNFWTDEVEGCLIPTPPAAPEKPK